MNKIEVGLLALLLSLSGCATTEGTARKIINANKTGHIVGIASTGNAAVQLSFKKDMCSKFKLNDARCNDDNLDLVPVLSEFGFAKGWTGGVGFAAKSMNLPDIEAINCNTNFGRDKNCTYVKLQVSPNGFGTVTEVISRPSDKKCHWSGGGKMGGVVCEGIFNYTKDNQAATSQ
jgi:hypothetical protein